MSRNADIKLFAKFHNDWIDHSPANKIMHIKQLGQALTHLRYIQNNVKCLKFRCKHCKYCFDCFLFAGGDKLGSRGISLVLELINSNRDAIRKAREAFLIYKAKTLEPSGMNRRDEI